jgi:peptidoglycan/LPS O-acetylase OafA/YrhL
MSAIQPAAHATGTLLDDSVRRGHWRADIEGLRALAILAVVGDHANVPFMQGGFIGVDIFFVLSGYLITSILMREISSTGRVSLVDFYARRLKRLFPALALMLLATCLAATVLLAPAEQLSQTAAAGAASLWLSNMYFVFAEQSYFDAGSENNLFLHTWSLGVEEQFYLLWPFVLLFLVASAKGSRRDLLLGMGVILLADFVLGVVLSGTKPIWAFYTMPARGWQFALGGMLAMLAGGAHKSEVQQDRYRNFAGWLGLVLVIASVLTLSETDVYPGVRALLPSVGAALLLYAGTGASTRGSVSALLAISPMRFLGKVSYSWYLWHWPVLVFGATLWPTASLAMRCALVAFAFFLAVVTYFLVEQPLRDSTVLQRRPSMVLVGSLAVMVLGVSSINMSWRPAAMDWAVSPSQAAYNQVRSDLPALYAAGCDDWYASARVRACAFGDAQAERTTVLFGDSVAAQWFSALAATYAQAGSRLVVVTKSSCPMVDEPLYYARIRAEYLVCEEWREAAIQFIAELQPEAVFLGSAATYDYSMADWVGGTGRVLEGLSRTAGGIFLIHGSPRLPFDGLTCLSRKAWQPAALAGWTECNAPVSTAPDLAVLASLLEAASSFANVRVLDFADLLCPDTQCRAEMNGEIVFRDSQHVTNRFVNVLTPAITAKIVAAKP